MAMTAIQHDSYDVRSFHLRRACAIGVTFVILCIGVTRGLRAQTRPVVEEPGVAGPATAPSGTARPMRDTPEMVAAALIDIPAPDTVPDVIHDAAQRPLREQKRSSIVDNSAENVGSIVSKLSRALV